MNETCPDGWLTQTQFCNTHVCQAPACYAPYVTLYDSYRRESVGNTGNCDKDKVDGTSWYRFHLATGENSLLDRCPKRDTCGTLYSLWMKGTHPTKYGVVLSITVYLPNSSKCDSNRAFAQVTKCNIKGDVFYLYRLWKPTSCNYSYCTKVYDL